ncbi:hypothetical protein [Terriglobus roseus]|uniref:Uncharacterized protein n=1 Tax=Terriglobus roseus TaxID=392734 RepID=A0A1H4MWH9_9BACT|nr:hypothetical protein [Terriglobus roseus]SEB87431.1 hypothetical protein SAMN05443244_2064 [Terriglobus roseus]
MQYLNAAEYMRFGLGEETGDDLMIAASAMIDAFCRRPTLAVTQYVERLRISSRRQEIQLSNRPLAPATEGAPSLVAVRVRLGRHGSENPLMREALTFAPQGTWIAMDVSTLDVSPAGSIAFATHLLGVPFDEAEVTYTAGFAEIPVPVKVACAQIVRNAQAMPALNVKRQALDSMAMEYFRGALLDDEVKRLLAPYVAERMG